MGSPASRSSSMKCIPRRHFFVATLHGRAFGSG
jgi:hypothetical protein